MNSEDERHHEYMLRMSRQANQQDDVRRGPFPKRYGFTCPSCGSVHSIQKEVTECRDIG